jgi:hypothetical protein
VGRHAIAEKRFEDLTKELEMEAFFWPRRDWFDEAPEDPTNLHRPFGYILTTDGFRLHFCVELVVAQSADLTDREFEAYLDVIDVHLCKHISHLDADDLEADVDNAIYEMAPGSLRLLNEVSMRALDRALPR